MKNVLIILIVIVAAVAGYMVFSNGQDETAQPETNDTEMDTETDAADEVETSDGGEPTVTPIEHATLVLEWDGTTIYVDPVGGAAAFAGMSAPDLILVTDVHGDHLDAETLAAVIADDTTLVTSQAVADELPEELAARAGVLQNGATTNQKNISIEAIPMYNLPESEDSYHVKGRGNGYVLERGDTRVYVAGDTEGTPEMRALMGIDIAFVPMNLPYTMSIEDAADAVLDFAPTQVYPYHYRGQDGLSDVGEFQRLVSAGNPNIEVVLLDWYPEADAETDAGSENVASAADSESGSDENEGEEVVIDLTGRNYEFSAEEIRVSEGDTVTINFTSTQGFHDWAVDAFGRVATDRVQTGETASVTFVANETGTFEYYCSVGNHRAQGMVGMLIVE